MLSPYHMEPAAGSGFAAGGAIILSARMFSVFGARQPASRKISAIDPDSKQIFLIINMSDPRLNLKIDFYL